MHLIGVVRVSTAGSQVNMVDIYVTFHMSHNVNDNLYIYYLLFTYYLVSAGTHFSVILLS